MGWYALLVLPGIAVAGVLLAAFDRWLERWDEPPYAPHGVPGRTIPFCCCSQGSQRLGMHF